VGIFKDVVELYSLNLEPVFHEGYIGDGFHLDFAGIPGFSIIEDTAWVGDDFNPFYHSVEETIDKLNLPYLTEVSRACTGWITHMAKLDALGAEEPIIPERPRELVALSLSSTILRSQGTLTITSPCPVTPCIYDASGRKVATLTATSYSPSSPSSPPSPATVHFDVSDLPAGVYWVSVQGTRGMVSARFVLVR
jgi:hypothetical protein